MRAARSAVGDPSVAISTRRYRRSPSPRSDVHRDQQVAGRAVREPIGGRTDLGRCCGHRSPRRGRRRDPRRARSRTSAGERPPCELTLDLLDAGGFRAGPRRAKHLVGAARAAPRRGPRSARPCRLGELGGDVARAPPRGRCRRCRTGCACTPGIFAPSGVGTLPRRRRTITEPCAPPANPAHDVVSCTHVPVLGVRASDRHGRFPRDSRRLDVGAVRRSARSVPTGTASSHRCEASKRTMNRRCTSRSDSCCSVDVAAPGSTARCSPSGGCWARSLMLLALDGLDVVDRDPSHEAACARDAHGGPTAPTRCPTKSCEAALARPCHA